MASHNMLDAWSNYVIMWGMDKHGYPPIMSFTSLEFMTNWITKWENYGWCTVQYSCWMRSGRVNNLSDSIEYKLIFTDAGIEMVDLSLI